MLVQECVLVLVQECVVEEVRLYQNRHITNFVNLQIHKLLLNMSLIFKSHENKAIENTYLLSLRMHKTMTMTIQAKQKHE